MKKRVYSSVGETLWEETLPNGLRIIVDVKPDFARSTAIFGTRYGGADRRFRYEGQWLDTPAGIAHYLEHKMFDMPDGTNALSAFSARGASANAFTAADMTAYYFSCTEDFDTNLRALLEFVSTPYYTAESVQKEQGIIGQEISMGYDNPFRAGYQQLMQSLYAVHPIRESIAGTVESIAQITADTLYRCHRAFYTPSNMILAVVGNVDPEAVVRCAKELLPETAGEVPERDYGREDSALPKVSYAEKTMAVSAPQFFLGSRVEPPKAAKDFMARSVLSALALDCLCGSASPLYNRLYSEGLLSRSFGVSTDISAGTITALLCGESRDPKAVLEALNEEIARIARSGLDVKQFERCRRSQFGSALAGLDDFRSLSVALTETAFHGWCFFDEFSALARFTADDAAAFLCDAFSPERLAMSVIRPAADR